MAFACWPYRFAPLGNMLRRSPSLAPKTLGRSPSPIRRACAEAGSVDVDLEPHELDLNIAVGRELDAAVEAALAIGPRAGCRRIRAKCAPLRSRYPRQATACRSPDPDREGPNSLIHV
jgi:hypothetical protein